MPEATNGRYATALLDGEYSERSGVQHPVGLLPGRNLSAAQVAAVAADGHRMEYQQVGDIGGLAERVMAAIEHSACDFRTPQGLARELGASEREVRAALAALGTRVRRPIGAGERHRDWFRSSARPRTRRELWWRFRALAGHTTPGV